MNFREKCVSSKKDTYKTLTHETFSQIPIVALGGRNSCVKETIFDIKEELKKIGLIKDASEVSKYYYHGVSHHIGLEVHDLSVIEPLKAGEIISNEPGLYIKEEGIGIRIEDDILITENGAICLSQEILKEVDDIEKFIEEHRK